ncbi:hypothetical protein E5F05_03735 (plasmid) [Deinococcus metallilatus]|uniref:DUF4013 domain-containing protein n=1 Tax=Deinococcus metallilatus TaxID=1211322 RepID=A0AAJ5JZQ5_9DEIO|nr:hypothetical protein [Deinococcus metallilatus]MBB5293251.1 hypothetical protein [Deinococcus metallilatus]QBY07037.1 hypothetical protein E5F05_03735 [Deinococcus metallilatus]RXJ18048.1 hypothetical protein ERJ73_01385 [Deinococcus metallilatus]TLK31984.1 hypothetical protein FCS05_00500 [Deinococcus metallilatus]GMA15526.1 hypothetical protein GCM10025871_18570 [Deinococcus metallilatus]
MWGAVRVWRTAGAHLWDHLPRLIVVNVLWLVAAWPLVTLGAATLTAYAWLRRAVLEVEDERDDLAPGDPPVPDEPYTSLPRFFRRLWWPGTLWAALNILLLFVLYANGVVWRVQPDTLSGALRAVLGLLLGWFWLVLQPFFLDALAEGVPLPHALAGAARIVLAYPLYTQLCALPPLLLSALAWRFTSLWALVGVGLLLLYWAHVATGNPLTRRPQQVEDVL